MDQQGLAMDTSNGLAMDQQWTSNGTSNGLTMDQQRLAMDQQGPARTSKDQQWTSKETSKDQQEYSQEQGFAAIAWVLRGAEHLLLLFAMDQQGLARVFTRTRICYYLHGF